jgi:hypothetical protein
MLFAENALRFIGRDIRKHGGAIRAAREHGARLRFPVRVFLAGYGNGNRNLSRTALAYAAHPDRKADRTSTARP